MIEQRARVAAPVALALFVIVGALLSPEPLTLVLPVSAATIAIGAVLAARDLTGWPLVVGCAVAAAGLVLVLDGQSSNVGWFAICVLAAWVALTSTPSTALVLGVLAVGLFAGQWLSQTDEPGWGAWTAGTLFTLVVCIFHRRQRQLVEQLQEAQAGLADRARVEERNRIAGEMHDVIGHALTVSLLHVTSARLALDEDPVEARASLDEAERLARSSLEEVRGAVGLMRGPGRFVPMPTASDIDELVESFRRVGTSVDLVVRGELGEVGATRGLVVYRIVQESLTNVVRHAAGAAAWVRIENGSEDMTVTVTSDGAPDPSARDGSGVLGMRERAATVGGQVVAGPWQGGWRVSAVLPW